MESLVKTCLPFSHLGGDALVDHAPDVVPINVNSFRGSGAVVRVAKKPGMESQNLLAEETSDSDESAKPKEKKKTNLWNSLSK